MRADIKRRRGEIARLSIIRIYRNEFLLRSSLAWLGPLPEHPLSIGALPESPFNLIRPMASSYAPLSQTNEMSLNLVTIAFSHFCERGRWALDLTRLPYREVRSVPLLHMPIVSWWQWRAGVKGRRDAVSSPLSTPMLLGRSVGRGWDLKLTDSADIMRWAADKLEAQGPVANVTPFPPLYPAASAEDIQAFEADAARNLGPHVRVFAYYHLLPERRLLLQLGLRNCGPLQGAFWCALLPLVKVGLRKGLGITPQRMERARAKILDAFAQASARLEATAASSGCSVDAAYFFGTAPTAADITFAALGSIAVGITQAEGYGAWLPAVEESPEPLRALRAELLATPAGRHIVRMYRDHRRGAPPAAAVGPRL
jgi:glutathione S-transferase